MDDTWAEWVAQKIHYFGIPFRRGWRRVKRFYIWFPVIWHDEDWDSWYLLKIMRFKIGLIREDITRADRHVGCEKVTRNMRVVEELLKRLIESEYLYHGQKSEFCTCKPDQFDNWLESEDPEDLKKGLKRWRNPFCSWCCNRLIMKIGDQREKDDQRLLFEMMRKHINKWWD